MTTRKSAEFYEAQHKFEWSGRGWAVYNPLDMPENELPVIYGFNNGGPPNWMSACLIAEDGADLGGHLCSSEGFMPHDLGVLEGSRPDRHETFREYYPNGYRMEFVGYKAVRSHKKLMAAIKISNAKNKTEEEPTSA